MVVMVILLVIGIKYSLQQCMADLSTPTMKAEILYDISVFFANVATEPCFLVGSSQGLKSTVAVSVAVLCCFAFSKENGNLI